LVEDEFLRNHKHLWVLYDQTQRTLLCFYCLISKRDYDKTKNGKNKESQI